MGTGLNPSKDQDRSSVSPKFRRPRNRSHLATYAVILASIVVILAGIQAAKTVLAPIFMATFLSVILVPPLRFLRSKGFSPIFSLTVVILSVLIIGISTTTIITTQLNQFSRNLPDYSRRFNDVLMSYNLDLTDIFPFLEKKEVEPPTTNLNPPDSGRRVRRSAPAAENPHAGDHVRSVSLLRVNDVASSESPTVSTKEIPASGEASPIKSVASDKTLASDVSSPNTPGLQEPARIVSLTDQGEASETGSAVSPETARLLTAEEDESDQERDYLPEDEEIPPPTTWVDTPEKAVKVSSQQLFSFLRGFIGELTVFASNAFIVMLLVIFMLLEASHLPEKLAIALEKRQNLTSERLIKVTNDIRRYMTIKTFVSLLVGLCVTVMLTVMGVQYPVLWGIIAFFLNFIPNIGSVVAAIPPIILATVDQGVVSGLVVAVFMVIINCVIGYILEPKLLGNGLDLSPLVVLFALIFFGWLLGPVGMFLSPPLAVIGKIILQSFPETKWIAILMANRVPVAGAEEEP